MVVFTDKGIKQKYSFKRGWSWWDGHRWSRNEKVFQEEVRLRREEQAKKEKSRLAFELSESIRRSRQNETCIRS